MRVRSYKHVRESCSFQGVLRDSGKKGLGGSGQHAAGDVDATHRSLYANILFPEVPFLFFFFLFSFSITIPPRLCSNWMRLLLLLLQDCSKMEGVGNGPENVPQKFD